MKTYEVLVSEMARRQLRRLPVDVDDRIKRALVELADDPFNPRPKADIKRLEGPRRDYFRLRTGDYRAIFVVEGSRVLVARILPRSKAYEWLD